MKCGLFAKRVHCTLTAARLLAAGTKPGNNLDQCLERYLGIPPAADHSRSDWASMLLTDDQLAYAARDVAHLHDLLGVMETRVGDGRIGHGVGAGKRVAARGGGDGSHRHPGGP